MQSPKGYELQQLAGSPDQLDTYGQKLKDLASTMARSSLRLAKIGESEVSSKGTRELKNDAEKCIDGLNKAEIRYRETGSALLTYSTALRTAQTWIGANEESIRSAQNAADSAQRQADDAKRNAEAPDLDADQKSTRNAELNQANSDLDAANNHLNELWTTFETKFEEWDAAYNKAVTDLSEAQDRAKNNDGFWDVLDKVLAVLAIVGLVVAILAICFTGVGFLAVLGVVIGALSLLGTLVKFFAGRASLGEVFLAALGVIPFGKLAKLTPVGKLDEVMTSAKSTVSQAIRSTPLKNPFSGSGIFSRIGNGLANATPIRQGREVLDALRKGVSETWQTSCFQLPKPKPGQVGFMDWLAHGGRAGAREHAAVGNFVNTMKTHPYSDALAPVIDDALSYLSSNGAPIRNAASHILGLGAAGTGVASSTPGAWD